LSDAATTAVELAGVRFAWPGAHGFSLAVERFSVAAGESVLLTGPSGSGKSTLLSLIAGIAVPASGTVRLGGTELATLGGSARDRFRAERCGIIFQMFNLLPYLSVIDNVLLPLHFAAKRRQRAQQRSNLRDEARRLLERLGLESRTLGDRPAGRLSVGQQQRVAAARALIGRPTLVIADEPTSALDRDRQRDFVDLLFEEVHAADAALLMVSHDPTLAERFDRCLPLAAIASVRNDGMVG